MESMSFINHVVLAFVEVKRCLIGRSVRKLLAAFVAAAIQDGAAGLGSHPGEKAVLAGAVTLLWLVGSFWHTGSTLPHVGAQGNPSQKSKTARTVTRPFHFDRYDESVGLVKITMFNPPILTSFPRLAKYFPQILRC